jgi:hypothetical protein
MYFIPREKQVLLPLILFVLTSAVRIPSNRHQPKEIMREYLVKWQTCIGGAH